MRLVLPKLYVILDAALLSTPETDCARQVADVGVRLLQYRNKQASARELLHTSRGLSGLLRSRGVSFIVNDRPDVAFPSGADGVHVGQDDLDVEQTRSVAGPGKWVGISTHNLAQFRAAASTPAYSFAVGPTFSMSPRVTLHPVQFTQLICQVRRLT